MRRVTVIEDCAYISFTKTCCFSGSAKRDEGTLSKGYVFEAFSVSENTPQKGVTTVYLATGALHPDRWLVPTQAVRVEDYDGNESEKL